MVNGKAQDLEMVYIGKAMICLGICVVDKMCRVAVLSKVTKLSIISGDSR